MSNFDEIELLLFNLLTAGKAVLSESECAEIQRFIDVGEYGLALETAVDIYAEEKKIASAEVVVLIDHLAKAMAVDPEPLLRQLLKSPT
jgi:dihydroxyacetone kinase DhaKLM complex PTS-EIIA-like component DhaM